MKKLKKSSNNKAFSVVIFYGTFAVGKYTVANEFHKQTGYKFFHNHHAYDLAISLFDRKSVHLSQIYEGVNQMVMKEIALAKINVVTTHAFSAKYVSNTGLSDPAYMKRIESIITRGGGAAYFIHLKADQKTLLRRVTGNSRKKFHKIKDPIIFEKVLNDKNKDWNSSAPVKNNLIIDNTKLSPDKVVDIVIKHFSLK